jgi:3-deoxy-D-manno-octulosonic-acid transferase
MTDYKALLTGYPIYIATQEFQRRKHKKKRINKKWRKRYGCYELNLMPHGEIVMMDNGVIWMIKRTFENLKKSTGKERKE